MRLTMPDIQQKLGLSDRLLVATLMLCFFHWRRVMPAPRSARGKKNHVIACPRQRF